MVSLPPKVSGCPTRGAAEEDRRPRGAALRLREREQEDGGGERNALHSAGGVERERRHAAEDQGDPLVAVGRRQEGVRRGGQGKAVAARAVSSPWIIDFEFRSERSQQ